MGGGRERGGEREGRGGGVGVGLYYYICGDDRNNDHSKLLFKGIEALFVYCYCYYHSFLLFLFLGDYMFLQFFQMFS